MKKEKKQNKKLQSKLMKTSPFFNLEQATKLLFMFKFFYLFYIHNCFTYIFSAVTGASPNYNRNHLIISSVHNLWLIITDSRHATGYSKHAIF